jgi:hypothetical protein
MPAVVVVLGLPVADCDPRVGQGPEEVDIEAFVAEAAVEGLDVAVPPGLAGWDECEPDAFAGPLGHRGAGQFGAVVAAQHGRVATLGGESVELVDDLVGGDGAFDQSAEAFAGVLVDDGDDLDGPAVGGGVELEVHRPHPVRRIRGHRAGRGCDADALAAPGLGHPEPFVAPQPLNLLVVHRPALTAGIMVSPAMAPPRVGLGVVPQPLSQSGVRVGRCGRGGLVSLGGSVLPGHPTGEPFTQTHHVDEVVHGRPPACRAQKFPEAISFNAAFSSSASASNRFNVEFSRSRSFSRFASSAFNPPNWFRHR